MGKKLVLEGPEKLVWKEYEEPPLKPGQVRVVSKYSAAKHGTEMALYKGYSNFRGGWNNELKLFEGGKPSNPYPRSVGNMFVGEVSEIAADVTNLSVGEIVFGHDGFADTHVIDAGRLRKLPGKMNWQAAVCLDPAEFAFGAVRDGNIRIGDRVAVFGMGAIGLVAVQLARISGATKVIAVDPLANRRQAAKRCGADEVVDPTACDAGRTIKEMTAKLGADVCIEVSGSRQALQHAVRGVAFGGTVVCVAYPPPYDAGLDFGAEAHLNRPQIVFSRACSDPNREHPRWSDERIIACCFDLLVAGAIRGEAIVDPVVPFAKVAEEYQKIARDPGANIKLGCEH